MTEFSTIKESIENHKGNFKGSCIKASDLKSGTKNNKDWTMKVFTLQDTSGEVEIAAFKEEIKLFEVGQFYEVESPWWKEYKDRNNQVRWSCNIGEYCHITKVDNPPTQTTIPKKTSDEGPEDKGPQNGKVQKVPDPSANLLGFIDGETIMLLQIRDNVKKRMLLHQPRLSDVNGAELGGYTLEIYRQYKLEGAKA